LSLRLAFLVGPSVEPQIAFAAVRIVDPTTARRKLLWRRVSLEVERRTVGVASGDSK